MKSFTQEALVNRHREQLIRVRRDPRRHLIICAFGSHRQVNEHPGINVDLGLKSVLARIP